MKKKHQNIFLIFGIIVLAIMVSQLNFAEVWKGLQHAGYWFFAVVLLWVFLYIFNTAAWWIIIKSGRKEKDGKLSFLRLYKFTVTGFALNYATPGGLMGGEPYRIMALSPYIGTERATSSVVLYAMTHIFSHFWFWLISIFLYIFTQEVTLSMGIMLFAIGIFCLLGLWFFFSGYKKGLALRAMKLMAHFPGIRHRVGQFIERHQEQLNTVDEQIAALHRQNPNTFITAVLLEIACRITSALEIYFILLVIMPNANYIDCILILAFTSFLANLLFFIPLQMGGREGGFLLSTTGLAMSASTGIFVALIVRLRELIWVAIGLLLIKLDK
jgi:uncharacterized membrane protein YbhN (UPF0104 family)